MTVYEVIGTTAYAGFEPGETFEAELDSDAEERALERGAIRIVKNKKEKEDSGA